MVSDQELALRAVGFPKDSIFDFDAKLFEVLRKAFEANDSATLDATWDLTTPLSDDLPEMDLVVHAAMQQEAAPG